MRPISRRSFLKQPASAVGSIPSTDSLPPMKSINRRRFLSTTTGALGFGLLGSRLRGANARKSKPNLVFLWTDQQRADTFKAYDARTRVQAPNLDQLASQSVVFENASVTQPVCTPSRSSVMTGLWPHQNGCTRNNRPLQASTKCFPELLGDSDYRTGYIGKWHLGDELFAQHGFEEWVATEDGYEGGYSPGRDKSARSPYHHFLIENGHTLKDGAKHFDRGYACSIPVEFGKPAFQARRAVEFLRKHRASPFILHVNYLEPHAPYKSPFRPKYDQEPMDPYPSYYTKTDDDFPLRYRADQRRDGSDPKYNSEGAAREIRRQYSANVTVVDWSVGKILTELETLGLADNTIVVFTSDHGDQMAAHRLWHKTFMLQESVRVPYLIRFPGASGRLVKDPVSHIDIVPTILDLMGARASSSLPGQSLMPLLKDTVKAPRQRLVFSQWNPASGTNISEADARFTRAANGAERFARHGSESTRAVISPDGWKLCL